MWDPPPTKGPSRESFSFQDRATQVSTGSAAAELRQLLSEGCPLGMPMQSVFSVCKGLQGGGGGPLTEKRTFQAHADHYEIARMLGDLSAFPQSQSATLTLCLAFSLGLTRQRALSQARRFPRKAVMRSPTGALPPKRD